MSDDTINIEIDGQTYAANKGEMIIQVADRNGIHIPRFCYHPKLSVAANCRMCLVEVERAPKPLPACATPIGDGMKITTASPLARRAQKSVMEFLLINHPLDCPICDQGGECELQDVAMGYGRSESRFVERKRVVADKDLGPLISTEMTRCIHCTRCVRFGEEIAGLPELGVTGRGEDVRIGTFVEKNVESELSGNVIDVCPVGALTNKPFRFKARTWELQQRPAIAPHDALGSNLSVHIAHDEVQRIVPRANEGINEVWLSDRDRFSFTALYSDDRLRTPMVKRDGQWREVDWASALEQAAVAVQSVAEKGVDKLGILASPSATLEELYLLQKLARGLGSQNIDHRLRQTDFSDQDAWPWSPGLDQSIADLEHQEVVLVVGSNTRKELPLLNHRLRKAALAGAQIYVLDATLHEVNMPASAMLVARPDAWAEELAGIACAAGASAGAIGSLTASDIQTQIGQALKDAEKATVLLGAGVLNHPQGAVLRGLAGQLAEASGASLGLLLDGANGRGAWVAGAVPHRDAAGQGGLAGLTAQQMLAGGVDGLVLFGCEPELDAADSAGALKALQAMSCVVSLTAYKSEKLLDYADVLLPISPFAETSGSYLNIEGTMQRSDAVVPPTGDSRPGWKVLRVLGNLLDVEGFGFTQIGEVRTEIDSALSHQNGAPAQWAAPVKLPQSKNTAFRIGDVPAYAVDALVRRAQPLQDTIDARFQGAQVSMSLVDSLGLKEGDRISVRQDDAEMQFEVTVDEHLAPGCVRLPSGLEATAGLGVAYGEIELTKMN